VEGGVAVAEEHADVILGRPGRDHVELTVAVEVATATASGREAHGGADEGIPEGASPLFGSTAICPLSPS